MGEIIPFTGAKVVRMAEKVNAKSIILSCLEGEVRQISDTKAKNGESPPTDSERRKNILDRIDQIRHLIVQGRIEDFIFVGRDVDTRHFLTEVELSDTIQQNRTEIFAFVGVTDAIKLELTERAQLAPALLPDGSVYDPYKEEAVR